MQSNYKRLGDYIRLVDERNRDLEVETLLGVSIQKILMPSIANTIGTDMSRYKIIRRDQFAYGTVTSRNGNKISIALLKDYDKALVSQIYLVFEITDEKILLPDYLMMWFRRPEFDRYARYKSHGSARETFDWSEIMEVELPVPDIEKQKELVAEYEAVEQRIQLNNTLCEKLEETAQTVYRHWFEDFEFPVSGSGAEALEAPYKSSGGGMVYCEELDKEIPKGWRVGDVNEIAQSIITGKTPPTNDLDNYGDYLPFLTIPDMHNKVYVYEFSKRISEKGKNTQRNKTLPIKTLCVSCIGTPGLVVITDEKLQTNQQINSVILKDIDALFYYYFVFRSLSKRIIDFGMGAAVLNNLNKEEFSKLRIIIPDSKVTLLFNKGVNPIFEKIKIITKEIIKLEELKSLLLGKMAVE